MAAKNYEDLLQQIQTYERDLTATVKAAERFREDNRALKDTCESLQRAQGELKGINAEAKRQLKNYVAKLSDYQQRHDAERAALQGEIEAQAEEIDALHRQLLERQNFDEQHRLSLQNEVEGPFIERICRLESALDKERRTSSDLQRTNQSLRFTHESEKADLQAQLRDLRAKSEHQRTELLAEVDELKAQLRAKEDLESSNAKLKKDAEEARIKATQLKKEVEELESQCTRVVRQKSTEIDSLKSEMVQHQAEASKWRSEAEKRDRTLSKLTAELAAVAEERNHLAQEFDRHKSSWSERLRDVENKWIKETHDVRQRLEEEQRRCIDLTEAQQRAQESFEGRLSEKKAAHRALKRQLDQHQSEGDMDVQQMKDGYESKLHELEMERDALRDEAENARNTQKKLQSEANTQLESLSEELEKAQEENLTLTAKCDKASNQLRVTECSYEKRLIEHETLKKDYQSLQGRHRELMGRVEGLQKTDATNHDLIAKLKSELASTSIRLDRERRDNQEELNRVQHSKQQESEKLRHELESMAKLCDSQSAEFARLKTASKQLFTKAKKRTRDLKTKAQLLAQRVQQIQSEKQVLWQNFQATREGYEIRIRDLECSRKCELDSLVGLAVPLHANSKMIQDMLSSASAYRRQIDQLRENLSIQAATYLPPGDDRDRDAKAQANGHVSGVSDVMSSLPFEGLKLKEQVAAAASMTNSGGQTSELALVKTAGNGNGGRGAGGGGEGGSSRQ
ncbi:unnamed protein product [Vitrella brassicaformis CCMP3155]|uniref:Uncharacterized protein n=1 Tax=Vitrella brassicaformis (strain CCMP3155) TaxID=1169540 RepID=A0A0G4EMQ9_VITBC|nr:unnamed protein product [Vitrella brassicaformis CCMP3155]|eukprot:CEL98099.1 unnamed protein product [Vitrella brassicaformis CCMP3155]